MQKNAIFIFQKIIFLNCIFHARILKQLFQWANSLKVIKKKFYWDYIQFDIEKWKTELYSYISNILASMK